MNRPAGDRSCPAYCLVKPWWRLRSWLRPLVSIVVVLTACSPVDLTRFSDAVRSVADHGIGGTGIFGTITGFGSVLVNGLTIDFDQETVITNDGVLTAESALAVGQVVAIEAGSREGRLQARSIAIVNAVSGPITAVAALGTQIEVLGQTVELGLESLKTPLPTDLSAGQWVTVSGLRNAQGTIVASRIGRRAAGGRISVRGPVGSRTENGFTIGRLSVIAPGQGAVSMIERGLTTLVVGALTSAGLRAAQVEVASVVPFDGHLSRLSIEGFVGRREGQQVSISGVQASITDATEVRGKADNQLSANDRVTIDAVIEGGNTLATKIHVHAPASVDTRESRGGGIREIAARARERSDELSEYAGERAVAIVVTRARPSFDGSSDSAGDAIEGHSSSARGTESVGSKDTAFREVTELHRARTQYRMWTTPSRKRQLEMYSRPREITAVGRQATEGLPTPSPDPILSVN